MTTLVSSAFTGSDGAAWPAPWLSNGGTATINSNRGQLTTGTGAYASSEMTAGLSVTDVRADVTVRFPTVAGQSARINLRWDRVTGNGYRLIMPTEYNGFQIMKVSGFVETPLQEEFSSIWAVTTDYKVAFEASGKYLKAKRWTGPTEPAGWDLIVEDTTYTGAGDVALVAVSGSTGGARSIQYDDALITDTPLGFPLDRIGYHNDAFQGPDADLGTWTTFSALSESATRAYALADVTTTGLPFGGESAVTNAPDTLGPAALAELAALRFTFLNPIYHPDVWTSWTSTERATVAKNLGYRLRLVDASLPTGAPPSTAVPIILRLTNDGWARVNRARPAQIVFTSGDQKVARALALDVRDIEPGATATVMESVVTPADAGEWAMHIAFPDASAAIAARPEYALRLANTGVWDDTTGMNALAHTIAIS